MRRLSLACLLLIAACGSFKDAFTSRRDSAAEAGALKLAPDTLARILSAPRGLKLTKDAATFVTNLWVDYALFAQASAAGKLPSDSASAVKAAARKKADATLAKIRKGADFGQLAAQLSDDPGSKADEGFLPPSPKGRFVPTFDSAGWKLGPGETSGLVESPFGFQIIKRPGMDVVQ